MPHRTAQTIAQSESLTAENSSESKRKVHPNSLANLKPYPKGVSGNPGGRAKDVASDICRAIFEENAEAIYEALGREIVAKGSAYAFQVASDRAYGKLKQGVIHTGDEEGGPIQASIKVEFVKPDGDK